MIKMSDGELNLGLDLLRKVSSCSNSHNCWWMQRANLFETACYLPKGCPKENCQVIIFRKRFESDSPAFYAEALRLSLFDEVVENTLLIEDQGRRVTKKRWAKLERRTYNLHIFGQLLTIALYPLFLRAKQVPFLTTKEIRQFRKSYYQERAARQTLEKMAGINAKWFEWLESVAENLLSNRMYPAATVYLVYLFFKGLEKNQLPDLGIMPQEEKEKFFSEIVQRISV